MNVGYCSHSFALMPRPHSLNQPICAALVTSCWLNVPDNHRSRLLNLEARASEAGSKVGGCPVQTDTRRACFPHINFRGRLATIYCTLGLASGTISGECNVKYWPRWLTVQYQPSRFSLPPRVQLSQLLAARPELQTPSNSEEHHHNRQYGHTKALANLGRAV